MIAGGEPRVAAAEERESRAPAQSTGPGTRFTQSLLTVNWFHQLLLTKGIFFILGRNTTNYHTKFGFDVCPKPIWQTQK